MRISKKSFNNLRFYRKRANLQQQQVAEMLGLKSTSIISRWENNISYPDLINVFKLSLIYRVLIEDLYPDLKKSVYQNIYLSNSANQLISRLDEVRT